MQGRSVVLKQALASIFEPFWELQINVLNQSFFEGINQLFSESSLVLLFSDYWLV